MRQLIPLIAREIRLSGYNLLPLLVSMENWVIGPAKSLAQVRFGDFEFDCRSGELRRAGLPLKLQPQPGKVLGILVGRAPEIVTRQELVQQVWGSDTFVDFEQGLNFAIRQVRTALEDDSDHPRYLETLPKRGYRFIAEVERVPNGIASDEVAEPEVPVQKSGRSKWPWLAIPLLLLIAALILVPRFRSSSSSTADSPIQSIAVLPLVNLSPDAAQEYFSDGLTDELITELAKTGKLKVISRTSTASFKGSKKRANEIGKELRVDAIVEGTIERNGDRVRIRAQLIRTATDQHIWAESYDRNVGDVFELERDLAQGIARQIGLRTAIPAQPTKIAAAAHEDYLRGRYHWNKRTEAGLRKGIDYFQSAIEQEPNYALAYAGLADSYIMLANWGVAPPAEAYKKAKAAASKALELNDQLAEAHTSLAYVTLLYDWDWAAAEDRFKQAIALDPNYASAHHFYSILLMAAGRQPEALVEIRRAQELDPLSLIVNDVVGWIHYQGREYDLAIQQFRNTLEMDPNYVPVLLDLGTAYMKTGDYRSATAEFEKARTVGGESGLVLSKLAQAHLLSGNRKEGVKLLRRIQSTSAPALASPWELSFVYVALGEKQKALALLKQATDERVGWVIRLAVDPAFDDLRSEPEFQALLQRVRVPTSALSR